MAWHEIINDSLGGEPVSITYCPLTATAIGFNAAIPPLVSPASC